MERLVSSGNVSFVGAVEPTPTNLAQRAVSHIHQARSFANNLADTLDDLGVSADEFDAVVDELDRLEAQLHAATPRMRDSDALYEQRQAEKREKAERERVARQREADLLLFANMVTYNSHKK